MKIFIYKSAIIFLLTISSFGCGAKQIYKTNHCVVTYENIPMEYAKAICQTAVTARQVAIDRFSFDMPDTIKISVACGIQEKRRLYTDGIDRFYLAVKSEKDLLRPDKTGVYQIYGICHEIGHLAMNRAIKDHRWLTEAGSEGWAHYIGSRLVDNVYHLEKDKLWPDAYDYSSDGMKRLKRQLISDNTSETVKSAGLWLELARVIGDDHLMDVLTTWSKVTIDQNDPAVALKQSLLKVNDDTRVSKWWDKAELLLVTK
jgi:hypothetical protein